MVTREIPDLKRLRHASDEELVRLAEETKNAPPNTVTREVHRFADLLMDARGVLCRRYYGRCDHPWPHMLYSDRVGRTERVREIARELRAVERALLSRAKKPHRGRR